MPPLFTRNKKKGSYTLAEGEKSVEKSIENKKKEQRERLLRSRSLHLPATHRVHIMGGKKKGRKSRKTRKNKNKKSRKTRKY
jgi:hypothetical protein